MAMQEDLNAPSGAYESQFQAMRGLYIEAGRAREYDVHYPQYRRAVFEEEEYSHLSCDEKLWQVDFLCWRRINPWSQYPIPKPSPGSRYWGYSSTARWLTGRNAPSQQDMRGMEIIGAYGNQIPGVGQGGFVGGMEVTASYGSQVLGINQSGLPGGMLYTGAYGNQTRGVGQVGLFGRMEVTTHPGSQVLRFNQSGLPGGMGAPGSFSNYVSGAANQLGVSVGVGFTGGYGNQVSGYSQGGVAGRIGLPGGYGNQMPAPGQVGVFGNMVVAPTNSGGQSFSFEFWTTNLPR